MVFVHFDLHFIAFVAYSVKYIALLNHRVGVIVFASWRFCIC